MKIKTKTITKTVNNENPNITPNFDYWLVGLDDENYRIINDNKEPVLYPKYLFEDENITYPDSWIKVTYEDGEYYIDPPELSEKNFFERYFDGEKDAREIFYKYCVNNHVNITEG